MRRRSFKRDSSHARGMSLVMASAILGVLSWGGPARAQVSGEPAKASGDDAPVMFFLTESVRRGDGAEDEVSFWWKGGSAPNWSASDRDLKHALEKSGAEVAPGKSASRPISSVYATPYLPSENAAALANLLGSRDAFVGAIIYEAIPSELPVARFGWRALISVELVDAKTQRPVGQRIVLERVVFARNAASGLTLARQQATAGLAKLMLRTRQRASGPIGLPNSKEKLIVLRKAQSQVVIEHLRVQLLSANGVDDVVIRWVARGHIAFEINPGKEDGDDLVNAAIAAASSGALNGPINFAVGQDESVQNAVILDTVERVAPDESL